MSTKTWTPESPSFGVRSSTRRFFMALAQPFRAISQRSAHIAMRSAARKPRNAAVPFPCGSHF